MPATMDALRLRQIIVQAIADRHLLRLVIDETLLVKPKTIIKTKSAILVHPAETQIKKDHDLHSVKLTVVCDKPRWPLLEIELEYLIQGLGPLCGVTLDQVVDLPTSKCHMLTLYAKTLPQSETRS